MEQVNKKTVWIYAVLTLIQTARGLTLWLSSLDICRINSYSNSEKLRPELIFVWIYAVLTLIQTLVPNKSLHINVFRLFAIIEKSQ